MTLSKFLRHSPGGLSIVFTRLINLYDEDRVTHDKRGDRHANETGMDRVRKMLTYDTYGNHSTELEIVRQTAITSTIVGVVMGGIKGGNEAKDRFLERNEATKFLSNTDAKQKLQNKVYIGFAKGAVQKGWRVGLICTSLMFFAMLSSSYRGENGFIEYIIGGGAAGFIFRFKQGPTASMVAMLIGALFGTALALAMSAMFYVTGQGMEGIRQDLEEDVRRQKEEALQRSRQKRLKKQEECLKYVTGSEETLSNSIGKIQIHTPPPSPPATTQEKETRSNKEEETSRSKLEPTNANKDKIEKKNDKQT